MLLVGKRHVAPMVAVAAVAPVLMVRVVISRVSVSIRAIVLPIALGSHAAPMVAALSAVCAQWGRCALTQVYARIQVHVSQVVVASHVARMVVAEVVVSAPMALVAPTMGNVS